jgi:hypothetical protein
MIKLRKAATRIWGRFLAWSHLSEKAVCDRSRGMGLADYHDYGDDEHGTPWHMGLLRCKRCGKYFMI